MLDPIPATTSRDAGLTCRVETKRYEESSDRMVKRLLIHRMRWYHGWDGQATPATRLALIRLLSAELRMGGSRREYYIDARAHRPSIPSSACRAA